MNEESITSSGTAGLRALPEKIKRKVGRLFGRKSDGAEGDSHASVPQAAPDVSPELRERAAKDIREYAEDNETLFNRASRFEEKAERLQTSDGTTSESAKRRAERARSEIKSGLSELRASFSEAHGEEEGGLAFDAALGASCPQFAAPEE